MSKRPRDSSGIADRVTAICRRLERQAALVREKETQLTDLTERIAQSDQRIREMSEKGKILSVNVGGTVFEVPETTLLSEPDSFFTHLLSNRFAIDRDGNGCIAIDRDPNSFRVVLNFLRGYRKFALSHEEVQLVTSDAEYYHLPAMRHALGLDAPALDAKFLAGGGVNPEGLRLRVAYTVATVGDHFCIAGRHTITYKIVSSEYVGVGVISDSCVCFDQEFHKTLNCCVYYMTGVFYSNLPHTRKEEGLEKFTTGDIVTLHLDMDAHTIEYIIRGISARIVSTASASRLKFAVTCKNRGSALRIIETPEDHLALIK